MPSISSNAKWSQNGITVAGGREHGKRLNQLYCPYSLYVDDDQRIFIADLGNSRILEWKFNAANGQVVAGGNQSGCRTDQLREPSGVIIDKETNSILICDSVNRRIMRWSLHRGTLDGEIIIENIACEGLAMDDLRFLYVTDSEKHEVRRYRIGEPQGIVVAGGNGQGDRLDQLNVPMKISIDRDYSLYVSDTLNHRVMKWTKDATEGIIVAGGHGEGNSLKQLSRPVGLCIDLLGTVYVADSGNNRVMRWCKDKQQGDMVVGGNGQGTHANQLMSPMDVSLDLHGNMYVADFNNDRVQYFSIECT